MDFEYTLSHINGIDTLPVSFYAIVSTYFLCDIGILTIIYYISRKSTHQQHAHLPPRDLHTHFLPSLVFGINSIIFTRIGFHSVHRCSQLVFPEKVFAQIMQIISPLELGFHVYWLIMRGHRCIGFIFCN